MTVDDLMKDLEEYFRVINIFQMNTTTKLYLTCRQTYLRETVPVKVQPKPSNNVRLRRMHDASTRFRW